MSEKRVVKIIKKHMAFFIKTFSSEVMESFVVNENFNVLVLKEAEEISR
jgi:hypothetical protein